MNRQEAIKGARSVLNQNPNFTIFNLPDLEREALQILIQEPKIDVNKLGEWLDDNIPNYLDLDGWSQGDGFKKLAKAIANSKDLMK